MSEECVGLLLVDKPSGPTSHDIVAMVRRAAGQRRVGHAGTLDPSASGLLPLVLGVATRLVRFLPSSPKVYTGTLRLGLRSQTDDATGRITHRHEGALPAASRVFEAAAGLLGSSAQLTPAVSARKVDGQRLYRLARRGVEVEAPRVTVEVYAFELEPTHEADLYAFRADVSGGTYIRGLARDLGERLGCGGLLESLRRESIGPLRVSEAVALEHGAAPPPEALLRQLIPPEAMPLEPPAVRLEDPVAARAFRHGNSVRCPGPDGLCRALAADGRLLGIAERIDGRLQPRVVLPAGG